MDKDVFEIDKLKHSAADDCTTAVSDWRKQAESALSAGRAVPKSAEDLAADAKAASDAKAAKAAADAKAASDAAAAEAAADAKAASKAADTASAGASYYQMPKGLCPVDERIATRAECRDAHDALGLPRERDWAGSNGAFPGGCSTRPPLKKFATLIFNTLEPGKARGDMTSICKKASTPSAAAAAVKKAL